jgi:predicted amidohydrolase
MRAPLIVAVAQPACVAGELTANVRAHVDAIVAAQARVVVFPELSLTGYELDAAAVDTGDPALAPLVAACAAAESVALVGAPVTGEENRLHVAVLRVDGDGIGIAYRKAFLGDAEARRFSPGAGPAVLEVDGWRVGLGVCKDTGVIEHVEATAALGVDLYVAGLVDRPHELPIQDARAEAIARSTGAPVAFASFAGPTGGGYDRTAGSSAIWSRDGAILARAGAAPGDVARVVLSG